MSRVTRPRPESSRRPRADGLPRGFAAILTVLCGLAGCQSDSGLPRAARRQSISAPAAVSRAARPRTVVDPRASRLIDRATLAYARGEFDQAERLARDARRLAPFDPATHLLEARIASDRNDTEAYVAALKAALRARPGDPRLHRDLGQRLIEAGAVQHGLAALARARKLAPDQPRFASALAAAHFGLGDADEAARVLEVAASEFPDDSGILSTLVRVHVSRQDWPGAAAACDALVRLHPQDPEWRRQRARNLYRAGDWSRARSDYAVCVEEHGMKLPLGDVITFGDASLQAGELGEAARLFDEAAARNPLPVKDVEVLRAVCALRLGDEEKAESILEQLHERWPDDPDVLQSTSLLATDAVDASNSRRNPSRRQITN